METLTRLDYCFCVALILLNAVFAWAEIAALSNEVKLNKMRRGNRKAKRLSKLTAPACPLSSTIIQVAITLAGFALVGELLRRLGDGLSACVAIPHGTLTPSALLSR